jgi:hypothetical protein
MTQERIRLARGGKKNQQKSGVFGVNQTNCYDLALKFSKFGCES